MRTLLLATVGPALLLGFASCTVSASGAGERLPGLLPFTDPAATTAGVGVLRNACPLSESSREIRVWTGFGSFNFHRLVKFNVAPSGKVSGELYVWLKELSYLEEKRASAFRRSLTREWRCKPFLMADGVETCKARLRFPPIWSQLLRKLDRLGISTLPDESELPAPEVEVLDGIAMVVELCEAGSYRSYEYSNPIFRDDPEAVSAASIMETLGTELRPR